jgi:hypothetical protein
MIVTFLRYRSVNETGIGGTVSVVVRAFATTRRNPVPISKLIEMVR